MKERPILFNAEMVRAILDGRKTQTRRIMNPQPEIIPLEDERGNPGYWIPFNAARSMVRNEEMHIACPYGLIWDRLWVRETWGVVSHDFDENERIIDWMPDRPATAIHEMPFGNGYYSGHAIYAADGEFTWGDDDGHGEKSCWKPSVHMPRSACRLVLEITGVRVERLNDISEEDALAEGFVSTAKVTKPGDDYTGLYASDRFSDTWQQIYGQKSWLENPWVWVIEFRRVKP